jgi:signal transduction histidine kinase/ActR/RegA family two-component response regulator
MEPRVPQPEANRTEGADRRFGGLQSRIIIFIAGLLIAVLGSVLLVVNAVNSRNARAGIDEDLAVGKRVFEHLIEQNNRQLTQAADILSLDFAFRGAVATRDLQTIQSVLANHGARINADLVTLVSLDHTVIADTLDHKLAGRPFRFPGLVDDAEREGKSAGLAVNDDRLYQLVVVPVRAPEPIAWAVFGLLLHDRLGKELRSLARLDLSFFGKASGDGSWTLVASTLPRELQEAELRLLAGDSGHVEHTLAIDGPQGEYQTLVIPMPQRDTYTIVAVLAESVDVALAPYRHLGSILLALGVAALIVSMIGGVLILRHADKILQRQYREIKDNEGQIQAKNRELESEIEQRKEVESALRKSEDEAGAANRAKTEFLSNMSHELRTPMNAILGFAQLLESEPTEPLSTIQQRFVEQIIKAGRHLLELINEVLDLARVESGKMTLSVEPVALSSVMNECLPLIQNMAREKEISITPLPDDLRVRVFADYMRLKQAFLNLLSNAVKYNRTGGNIIVDVTGTDTDRVRVNVTDTGNGIPASMQGELFRPFHRLGLDTIEVEGTGIGLALTRSLVVAMGGEIGFSSVLGEGSTFWIELPVAPEDVTPAMRVPLQTAAVDRDSGTAGRSVLYVEDNPANVLLMEQIARRLSLRFLTAPNAELGIALAASEKPDLIVMDINLPQMNGYEALARLTRNRETASIPVMALTANAMRKDVERGLAAGFVRYMTKPIEVQDMERTIRQILDEQE